MALASPRTRSFATRTIIPFVALGLLALWSAPAAAADGRIPVYQVGTTISLPGSYYLTQDLMVVTASDAITITTSQVSLDLNGHAIYAATGYSGISSGGFTINNVRISNGTVFVGDYGIRAFVGYGSFVVDHMRFSMQNLGAIRLEGVATSESIIRDNAIVGPNGVSALSGIYVSTGSGLITGNSILSSKGSGISLVSVNHSLLAHNGISGSTANAITLTTCSGVTVEHNACSGGSSNGISLSGCTSCRIASNECTQNGVGGTGHGILLTSNTVRCEVRDNTVSGNTGYGISLETGCHMNRIYSNSASANGSGIVLSGANNNAIDNNFEAGGWWGLAITGSGNIYSNNRAPGTTIGIADGGGNTNAGGNF